MGGVRVPSEHRRYPIPRKQGALFPLLSQAKICKNKTLRVKFFEILSYFHFLIIKHLNQYFQKRPRAGFGLISKNTPLLAFSNVSRRLFGVLHIFLHVPLKLGQICTTRS